MGDEEEGDVVLLAVLEGAVVDGPGTTTTALLLLVPMPDAVGSLGCCWARMRLRLPLPPSMTTRPLMAVAGAREGYGVGRRLNATCFFSKNEFQSSDGWCGETSVLF